MLVSYGSIGLSKVISLGPQQFGGLIWSATIDRGPDAFYAGFSRFSIKDVSCVVF